MFPPQSEAIILLILVFVPHNRDFLFYPAAQTNLTLFINIINHQTSRILVRNVSNQPLRILRCQKLGHLIDITYNNCFFLNKRAVVDLTIFFLLSQLLSNFSAGPLIFLINFLLKMVLDNNIKVYRDVAAIKQIVEQVAEYFIIWES